MNDTIKTNGLSNDDLRWVAYKGDDSFYADIAKLTLWYREERKNGNQKMADEYKRRIDLALKAGR